MIQTHPRIARRLRNKTPAQNAHSSISTKSSGHTRNGRSSGPSYPGIKKKGTKRQLSKQPATPMMGSNRKRQKRTAPVRSTKPASAKRKPKTNVPPSQKLDIYVCGSGDFGELGLGSRKTLVRYPRLNDLLASKTVGVTEVAVGGMHCVALTYDQKVLTWGVNDTGALGRETGWEEAPIRDVDASDDEDEGELNPKESTPSAIPMDLFGNTCAGFAQVAATDSASFALTIDGFVYGWGTFLGSNGKMGLSEANSVKNDDVRFEPRPVLVPGLKNIRRLAAGNNHMLALDHEGKLFAWGCGQQRQLGRRLLSRMEAHGLTPRRIGSPRKRYTYIAGGGDHSFAKDEQGRAYSWGLNNFCQTGIPSEDTELGSVVETPTEVTSLRGQALREIVGGTHHSLACTTDGELLVWGRCDDGQLGISVKDVTPSHLVSDSRGRPRIVSHPVVAENVKACAVAAGVDVSLAISTAGNAYAWGFSANYRTGLGTEETIEVATPLKNKALLGKKLSFGACGGQFSVLAGPAQSDKEDVRVTSGK